MAELLAVLGFGFLCKSHIFNVKRAVSQSMRRFHFFGNFQKTQKNTKNQQNFKNVKSDLLSFLHRYELISSEIRVKPVSYWPY